MNQYEYADEIPCQYRVKLLGIHRCRVSIFAVYASVLALRVVSFSVIVLTGPVHRRRC